MSGSPARSSYDAVVVGGGHNGLVAATYLARAGRSVLLLERRRELGGASVSVNAFPGVDARLSRYSYLVSLLPDLIMRELELPLELLRRRVSSYTPDPRSDASRGLLVDHGDPDGTAASFEAIGGAGAQGAWEDFYEMTTRVARAVFPTLTEPLRSRAQLRELIDEPDAWEALFEAPLADTLPRMLGDELIAGVALTDGLIGTFAQADDPDLRQNRCFLYHVIGRCTGQWLVPVGGMGALAAALTSAARTAGVELLTRAEVSAVHADEHGAEVRFEADSGGEQTVAAAYVLAGIAPTELARLCRRPQKELIADTSPPGSTAGADGEAAPPEGAQLKVNMLLARLPRLRERGLAPERGFAGTFHVNENAEQLQRAYEQASAGAIPGEVPCECYCHSLTDPSILGSELRDSGAQTLTVFALHMPARLFAADNDTTRAAALEATLRSIDSVLAEPIESCLLARPDGEPCLEARSPLDIERELRMPGGNIFHRDLSWPMAEREEDIGSWGVETSEPRLLLCGAGARRGGGVSGIPGRNAAMALLSSA